MGKLQRKKLTRFITNSHEVNRLLNKRCDGKCPRHVHLMEGRT